MAHRIRSHNWLGTPLGPLEGWPLRLRTLVAIVLNLGHPMALVWGPERTVIYNDLFAALLGVQHPGALGRTADALLQGVGDDLRRAVMEMLGDAASQGDDRYIEAVQNSGQETRLAITATPVHQDDDTIAGVICSAQATLAGVQAEQRMRESEARLRGVLDGMGEAFALLDRDFRILAFNEAALRLESRPLTEILGRSHWEVYPGSEDSELGRLYKRALTEQRSVQLEHRYTWEDGRAR